MKDFVLNGNAVTNMLFLYGSPILWCEVTFSIRASPHTLLFPFFPKASLHY
jgi:hypothetical protein